MTTATQNEHYNAPEPVLFLAFELSEKTHIPSLLVVTP